MSGKTLQDVWHERVETLPDAKSWEWQTASAELTDACTPRAPKPEWFGAPFDAEGRATGKWDAWWWRDVDGMEDTNRGMNHRPSDMVECLPVLREGYGPAGWQVVET